MVVSELLWPLFMPSVTFCLSLIAYCSLMATHILENVLKKDILNIFCCRVHLMLLVILNLIVQLNTDNLPSCHIEFQGPCPLTFCYYQSYCFALCAFSLSLKFLFLLPRVNVFPTFDNFHYKTNYPTNNQLLISIWPCILTYCSYPSYVPFGLQRIA